MNHNFFRKRLKSDSDGDISYKFTSRDPSNPPSNPAFTVFQFPSSSFCSPTFLYLTKQQPNGYSWRFTLAIDDIIVTLRPPSIFHFAPPERDCTDDLGRGHRARCRTPLFGSNVQAVSVVADGAGEYFGTPMSSDRAVFYLCWRPMQRSYTRNAPSGNSRPTYYSSQPASNSQSYYHGSSYKSSRWLVVSWCYVIHLLIWICFDQVLLTLFVFMLI